MIPINSQAFYLVYPPWAQFRWSWEKLPVIFQDPIVTGFLPDDGRLQQIGYEPGNDKFELISGPVGNGIIKMIGNLRTSRYLWVAALIQDATLSRIPGFPVSVMDFGVCWLEQQKTPEHKLGLEERFPTFLPKVSLEYDDCPDNTVYASLAFRRGNIDEEVCLRFQTRCRTFGLNCHTVGDAQLLPGAARSLVSSSLTHRWFVLERKLDDVGVLAAKMFYLGCAAKRESSRRFDSIHLVGAFEGKPRLARSWRDIHGKLIFQGKDSE